ncbi:putative trans-sialidase, Group V [Trypanosoma cruzi]|uniref:Trans-sialidase, putative n=2 Tax=Trypanosoma cruzi TaxID=5693 RepID=Q4E103_TRYCC|nr:trans-sialidase, putative [Trypanosoma cruzi]EAN98452.1 trans-sialidase, putative [Trypanosoma cruzi]PWV12269.1 putative trans-sialidase, Group V [Trypanosoma cruzi]|eukprot:XP_820303.1 trans-sialidase [Trypanosoma cruzi strain CL Brener]
MLSRVAAVKTPRTHNRRRVTGSSGRRREGGENEPQRPNMSRHLFYSAVLLLFVVMMCCGSGVAEQAPEQPSQKKFKWKDIKGEGGGVTVESLGAPGLLKVGSDVFAVAEAQCKKNSESVTVTGIASQIITTQTANTPVEVLNGAEDKTQFLEEEGSADPKKVDVSRPTTVVEGNDIYMLVGKYSQTAVVGPPKNGAENWGFLLVKGNVSEESGKRIQWNENQRLVGTFSADEHKCLTQLIGSGGSGVRMEDGTILFPVEGTKKKGDAQKDEKTVSLLIYTSEDNAANWKLSKEVTDGGCSDPSVVEWGEKEDKKLMMMTACDDGRRRVYESGDKGESWTEALGTLSRVWGNKQDGEGKAVRSGFITATIGDDDKKNVMLVTLPVYSKEADTGGNGKGKLHLWLTDNAHIVDIGPVSGEVDDAAASSLLYKSAGSGDKKKEELIALYEKDDGKPSHSLWSVLLTEQLQRVKDALATWKKVDDRVSKLCPSKSDVDDASTGDACSPTVKITDGLVGFLSGNFSNKTWRDEYLGVNATVENNGAEDDGAEPAENGVKFQGAWAEWPVGSQGENQPYHFANYNFTLVATVSIDGVPTSGSVPLMGVKMNDSGKTVLLGLSYNGGGKWELSCGDETPKELKSALEPGKTRQLAIVLRNGTQGSVYVDGERVCMGEQREMRDAELKEISHFYIGGDGENADSKDVSVTVTNVLLYNRPLDDTEIATLNPNKASTPSQVNEPSQGTAIQPPGGQGKEEQRQLLGSNGVNGVSASTVSSATTSSGEEGPATPLASEESFDVIKNVDGGSFSDGDPTVETAEGTDGQKEEIHAQNGEVNAAALSSSLGNVSQGNNSDAGTVRGSGLLPLLLVLLGLWGFATL